eukprot:TRINITY_DN38738_c0_g1_i1.p1 TRINITY_DN38738_c0_g1~~TRINITY_DN38738_c0_g1_i1.p1  ORF type:complete len:303 (+),score=78.12 TRINITY_DN38738_c0_g1_i1:74-982(+)
MPSESSASSSADRKKKKKKEKREKKESKKGKERKEERKRSRSKADGKRKDASKKKQKTREASEGSDDAPAAKASEKVRLAPMEEPSGLLRRSKSRDDPPRVPPPELSALAQLGSKGFGKGKEGGKDGGKDDGKTADGEPKEEPNFEASGLLGLEDNSKNGIALNFTLPPEARKPTLRWRMYVYTKQGEEPKIVHIHRQVGYLFGKDRRVVDIPTDHPTCSKQHAVLHYRLSPKGDVRPYLMDLESKNGTFLNGKKVEAARYTEIREGDALKFAMSSREYVILHSGSANHIQIDEKLLRSDSE